MLLVEQFSRLVLVKVLIVQEILQSFSFMKKQKKMDFSQGTVKVL